MAIDFPQLIQALQLDLLGRLLLAVLLGGLIGLEREMAGKQAGLRTNILICLGSALFTEMSVATALMANATNAAGVGEELAFRADPGRIASNVLTGVGFLGGGAILRSEGQVTGLTTAATIWIVAAIGMAVGAGEYLSAIGTTLLVLFILVPLRRLERFFSAKFRYAEGNGNGNGNGHKAPPPV